MLFQCWPNVWDAGPALKRHLPNMSCLLGNAPLYIQNKQSYHIIPVQCWYSVNDSGQALHQHGKNMRCRPIFCSAVEIILAQQPNEPQPPSRVQQTIHSNNSTRYRTARQLWRNSGPEPQTMNQHHTNVTSPFYAHRNTFVKWWKITFHLPRKTSYLLVVFAVYSSRVNIFFR